MSNNPLISLSSLNQSVWYDNIHREMLHNGELERMISEDGIKGITSNPTIFQNAISGSEIYDTAINQYLAKDNTLDSRALFYRLAIEDIQQAADFFLPIYQQSNCTDGYVSLEVSPDLAHDTDNTIKEAHDLFERVNRANVMIKIPATLEGLPAIESCIASGININVTLLFSNERYKEVTDAFMRGLEQRVQKNLAIKNIASVASFFISRVDSLSDQLLDEQAKTSTTDLQQKISNTKGKVAIANAKLAYSIYKQVFSSERFQSMRQAGAQPQRLLWASTGTKNKNYSDVLYIESLIGPETVNTMPPVTLKAFKDHGVAKLTLAENLDDAHNTLKALAEFDIDIHQITHKLEVDGVKAFADSFTSLLASIDAKISTDKQRLAPQT